MTSVTPPQNRIYLLRHAKSGWAQPGERDFDRALNDAGRQEAASVAEQAIERGYRPDLIVSSTARRCRETADAFRGAYATRTEFRYLDELYNCPADSYFDILGALKDYGSVMLVGHNPSIEEALFLLAGSEAAQAAVPEGFPTAGLAVLDRAAGVTPDNSAWMLADFLAG
ncbi:histidine phosphatase family protein [Ciceribacter sp. RN22]|uniref:SixA phosphatase family protein n=1 Tax=Ciceribacter sp. RN22 TaxID=2954932 RepID=UPI002091FD49|nr:histidine phosphatase family protein [Ciceribacter sp. RN22]MCO6178576.1 histidine phosphatase family protein [Ciceribacter sp. RN22]